jgi:sigma-54 specific flagellar transcriptional regulator A
MHHALAEAPESVSGGVASAEAPSEHRMPWEFGEGGTDLTRTMRTIELKMMERALELTGGNQKRAAQLLRLKRTTFVEKLKRMRARESQETLPALHG